MSKLDELRAAKKRIEEQIAEEHRRSAHEDYLASAAASAGSKWDRMTNAQRQHCCFLGIDPDDPDGPPLD